MSEVVPPHRHWPLRGGEFDERAGVLRLNGRTSELDRSSRAILTLLLENVGAPVAKERLLEAGWPAVIVHENSLAKAIGRLREALGNADLLKAAYGIGYKLDTAILAPGVAADGPSMTAAPVAKPSEAPRRLLASAAIAGALALIAVGFAWRSPSPHDAAATPLRTTAPVIEDAPDSIGKLLWVDDHPENNVQEKRFFERHRIAVHPVTTSADAFQLLAIYDYRAIISDMGRGEDRLAGARFVQQLRARNDGTPVVIYTVRADKPAKEQAQRELVTESGAQALAVTPEEVRAIVLRLFGNPPERTAG